MKQEFTFYVDRVIRGWERSTYTINAENEKEAKCIVLKHAEADTIDEEEDGIQFVENSLMHETFTNLSTREVFFEEEEFDIIYSNK